MLKGFRYRLRSPAGPYTIEDWRSRAKRKVPDMVWAYIENGADDERTLHRNEQAFREWWLRPRVLRGAGSVDPGLDLFGTHLEVPFLIAPTGLAGAAHWHGDLGLARAAEAAGTRLILSSASGYTMEEVAEGTTQAHWFQLYPWKSRELMGSLIGRAADSGYTTLVVTVDVPVYGRRVREMRTGMGIPPTISVRSGLDSALRPSWLWQLMRHRRMSLKNLEPIPGRVDPMGSLAVQSANLTADVTWSDLDWLRGAWDGPLLVKGVLEAEDAHRAVEAGADGVVVSNHGGRQLNATLGSLDALPNVVARVGERVPVLMDGGVRSGTDIVIALAMGARAVLIGRPAVYGLAAAGTTGVSAVLSMLTDELVRAMALMGAATVDDIRADAIMPAASRH